MKVAYLLVVIPYLFATSTFAVELPATSTIVTQTCQAVVGDVPGWRSNEAVQKLLREKLSDLNENGCNFSESDIASITLLLIDGHKSIVPFSHEEFLRLSRRNVTDLKRQGSWIAYRTKRPWWERYAQLIMIVVTFISLGITFSLAVLAITKNNLAVKLVATLPLAVGLVSYFFFHTTGILSLIIIGSLSPICAAEVAWSKRRRALSVVLILMWSLIAFWLLHFWLNWGY